MLKKIGGNKMTINCGEYAWEDTVDIFQTVNIK